MSTAFQPVMRAIDYDSMKVTFPCFIQPKLNGVYAQLVDGVVYSKTGMLYPAVMEDYTWPKYDFPLIGEFYKHGWKLDRISHAISGDSANEDTKELMFWVYDIACECEQHDRVKCLKKLWGKYFRVYPVTTEVAHDHNELQMFHRAHESLGYEGSIIRYYNGMYTAGKTDDVMKWKKAYLDEFKCIGVIEGTGKCKGHVGSFTCVTNDNKSFKVGGGRIPYPERKRLFQNPPIGKLLQLRYHYTSSYGIPQCPQFIKVIN